MSNPMYDPMGNPRWYGFRRLHLPDIQLQQLGMGGGWGGRRKPKLKPDAIKREKVRRKMAKHSCKINHNR